MPGSLDRPGDPRAPGAHDVPGRLRPAPRPDLPTVGDRSNDLERLAADDRTQPARWSRADLRQRLDHLPPGHPSSTRTDARHEARPDSHVDTADRNYWSEVPRFLQAWADHVRNWPAERAATADRSRDPDGSWRGDGNQYLDPKQNAQSIDVIAQVRRTETKVTEHVRSAEREITCDGWLEGLDHRVKGEDRLKEKIATELSITPAMKPQDAINKVNDAIRYTFCFEPASYSDGYWGVKQGLEAREYRMVYSKNHWRDDPEYKGINTRWLTPEGHRFEVQFHTPESYHAKQDVTHGSYERLRNPLTEDDERIELETFQRRCALGSRFPKAHDTFPTTV